MQSLRISNIHLFSFSKEKFVLDVNSGSLLKIDEPTFLYLIELTKGSSLEEAEKKLKRIFPDIQQVRNEIEKLIHEGILFSDMPDYFNSNLTLKSICLNVAHSCNFACKYCFAKKGSYGGKQSIMDFEISRKAIDFLIEKSNGHKSLEVDFFGGEPLLAIDTVKKTVNYAKENYPNKKFRFTLTTNASLITKEIENFLFDNDISVVLSLDGGKEKNDEFRIYRNGKGTYLDVIEKIKLVVENRRESQGYYVRGTYTHKTLDISKTVFELFNNGFDFISLEPVVSKDTEIAITEEDLYKLREEYEKLADFFVETQKSRKWQFFHFNIDLEAGPCIQKRIHGCGAGVEYIAISPNGDIYPCHQFDGVEKYKLGDIYSGITEPELTKKFKEANFLFNKKECSSCWARFYCSGGCIANNYNINGDMLSPYKIGCEIQKMRIEAALYVQYMLAEKGIKPIITRDLKY